MFSSIGRNLEVVEMNGDGNGRQLEKEPTFATGLQ